MDDFGHHPVAGFLPPATLKPVKIMYKQLMGKQAKLWLLLTTLVVAFLLSGANSEAFGYAFGTVGIPLLFIYVAEQSTKIRYKLLRAFAVILSSLIIGVGLVNLLGLIIDLEQYPELYMLAIFGTSIGISVYLLNTNKQEKPTET